MPSLICSAQNCVYNDAMYCSRGEIEVGGTQAENCQDTCCESFQERRAENMKSAMGTASGEIGVDCEAKHCSYNENCVCHAGKIDITGAAASSSQETECATFNRAR